MHWRNAIVGGLLGLLGAVSSAIAQSAPDVLARHIYAGTITAGERELVALSARTPGDRDTTAALGMIRFVAAIEHFGQGLYRYGMQAPRARFVPFMVLPVPHNPNPEKITYEKFRALLGNFVRELDLAQKTLESVGDASVKLPIDVSKMRMDIDGDGTAGEQETAVGIIMSAIAGPRAAATANPGAFVIGFDTADMYWLRGYCNLMATTMDFFLGHDFREMFDGTFHLLFPAADLPFSTLTTESKQRQRRELADDFGSIADAIAMVHLMRWPLAEPERIKGIHARLKTVVDLNRKTWAAVNAETDNDNEWLPNARQTGVVRLRGVPVNDATVAAWLAVIDQFEQILDGKLLVPHWRFEKGINIRKVLLEPKGFDLVLWATGHGLAPYLESGPISDRETWNRLTAQFGGNFLTYAFYFN